MLTGQAKTDYQREYMRRRRAWLKQPMVTRLDIPLDLSKNPVRPDEKGSIVLDLAPEPVRPTDCSGCKLLSYNPRVGLRCPRGGCKTSIKSTFEEEINPDSDCELKEAC